jgi:hypothetical protein
MTLSTQQTKITYVPDGLTAAFDVPFPVFDADDIQCVRVDGQGAESAPEGFTVTGMTPGAESDAVRVVFSSPPASGGKLVIRRSTARVQESDYPVAGRFPAKTVERDFDRVVGMIQELKEILDRAIKVDAAKDRAPTTAEVSAALDSRLEAARAAKEAALAAQEAASAFAAAAETSARNAAMSDPHAWTRPKAWVICGRNGVVVAAKNVASVTRVSAGIYTINFPEGLFATNQIIPCGIAHLYPMQTMSGYPDTADFSATRVTVTIGATYQTPKDSEFRLVFFECF